MAAVTKQTETLNIELVDAYNDTVYTWKINNPDSNVTRANVVAAVNHFFSASNTSGYNLIYNPTRGSTATALGRVETVTTVITTTELA